jgi:hypothetical protein
VHGQCVDGCRCHAQRATRYATAAEGTQKIDICAVARECVPDGSGPDLRHLLSKIGFYLFRNDYLFYSGDHVAKNQRRYTRIEESKFFSGMHVNTLQTKITLLHQSYDNVGDGLFNLITGFMNLAYDMLITRMLRVFYFQGPGWKNRSPEEICYEITNGVDARHWTSTEANYEWCQYELERRFQYWNVTVKSISYFTALSFAISSLIYCCCSHCMSSPNRSHHDACNCTFSNAITRDELKDVLLQVMRHQAVPPPDQKLN